MASTDNKSSSLDIGAVVAARFRITGVVGKGAMGSVYAAEHVGTGQAVALKFMSLGDDEGEEFVTRFEQEARVMATLRHPNTIRIYDFGRTDDGAMFMAMELLVGQPLDQLIRENTRCGQTMTELDAANCGIQILKSLAEAHGRGLVHRDLKPGNVFLTDDGGGDMLLKVLDFGIARVQDSALTNAGRIIGTPSYMCPEQWQGAKIDARADLYAVGCVLFCCVTGQPPFSAGDNMLSLLHKHCTEPVPDPRELSKHPLSDAFIQVITTALGKEPDDRYADARAMRTALEAFAGGAWAGTPSSLVSPGTEPYALKHEQRTVPPSRWSDSDGDYAEQPTLPRESRGILNEPVAPLVLRSAFRARATSRTAIAAFGILAMVAWWASRRPGGDVRTAPANGAIAPTAPRTTSGPMTATPKVLPGTMPSAVVPSAPVTTGLTVMPVPGAAPVNQVNVQGATTPGVETPTHAGTELKSGQPVAGRETRPARVKPGRKSNESRGIPMVD
jgi:serine/threonine protein kinase